MEKHAAFGHRAPIQYGRSDLDTRKAEERKVSGPVNWMPIALYVSVIVAMIVGLDIWLFRSHIWAGLIANMGIVLVFAPFCLRFFRQP